MMLLKEAKHIVPIQDGATMLGSQHGRVDKNNIIRMVNLLVEDEVFVNKPGRSFSGLGIVQVGVVPSVDTVQEGAKEIIRGKHVCGNLKEKADEKHSRCSGCRLWRRVFSLPQRGRGGTKYGEWLEYCGHRGRRWEKYKMKDLGLRLRG
jgi:hypothetical protein